VIRAERDLLVSSQTEPYPPQHILQTRSKVEIKY